MTWAQLGLLLIQFGPQGFALAEKLVAKWTSDVPLTQADIDEARRLGVRSPRDAMLESLIRSGIPLDSERAKALLALVPGGDSQAAAALAALGIPTAMPAAPAAPDTGTATGPKVVATIVTP